MGALRAGFILARFGALTVPLLPVQYAFVRWGPARWARVFPHWYHRQVCRLLGLRLHVVGNLERGRPVLAVANHCSWLDIPVLSAAAPVSFIAKKEVGGWPGVSVLARLQRTVFIDRERRMAVAGSTREVRERLGNGDTLVLFAEGTSSDGNQVMPFRSSLFAAAMAKAGDDDETVKVDAVVQTVTLAYTHLHGIPVGRAERAMIGWYGDMELLAHAWALLKAGPLDVSVVIGEPVKVDAFTSRKEMAGYAEKEVRTNLARVLRHRDADDTFELTAPAKARNVARQTSAGTTAGEPRGGMR